MNKCSCVYVDFHDTMRTHLVALRNSEPLARLTSLDFRSILSSLVMLLLCSAAGATDYYVSLSGGHSTPFTNWATAATNIQDAVEVAAVGDIIWVTNGVYCSGGKSMDGDLTNRVALDKAVTLRSVNGPGVTVIEGRWDPVGTNGPGAVRCAWLTNEARLTGFTLRGGATRAANSGSPVVAQIGGGLSCGFSNALVTDCIISDNRAAYTGGGVAGGTVENCLLTRNKAYGRGGGAVSSMLNDCILSDNSADTGGGAAWGTLNRCTLLRNSASVGGGAFYGVVSNCIVIGNSAGDSGGGIMSATAQNSALLRNHAHRGGGAYGGTLYHCTLTGNAADAHGGGAENSVLANCILWNNSAPANLGPNYLAGSLSYCCSDPLPVGSGNIAEDPLLLDDQLHIASTSPCRRRANPLYTTGTDIDGQSWLATAAIGCDEWQPQPAVVLKPNFQPGPAYGEGLLSVVAVGQDPMLFWWSKDGTPIAEDGHYRNSHGPALLLCGLVPADAGFYQVTVSNAFGVATSKVVQLTIHCVDATATGCAAPYTNWSTAAQTIQQAVDQAEVEAVILVTNGIYAQGGKAMVGDLTNRVALDKSVTLMSVNGPEVTIIQGQQNLGGGSGPGAVRCAWLDHEAVLSGFTLRGGATRTNGDYATRQSGGGLWCNSTNVVVGNSFIVSNAAAQWGGGAHQGTLTNCTLIGNSAAFGGAAYYSALGQCRITGNVARVRGGGALGGSLKNCALTGHSAVEGAGAAFSILNNCTLTANTASASGGGAFNGTLTNCILWDNQAPQGGNFIGAALVSCCAEPLAAGQGNIADDPQMVDWCHISTLSPCRGKGLTNAATGADIDGEPWMAPPSIGCDEVWEAALAGPLAVRIAVPWTEAVQNRSLELSGLITGRATRLEWAFGDGPVVTNLGWRVRHAWESPGDYEVVFRAYNSDALEGVATNVWIHVVPLELPNLLVCVSETGRVQLEFPSQAGLQYVLECATNLNLPVVWQTIGNLTSTGGVVTIGDPDTVIGNRFYRLRLP